MASRLLFQRRELRDEVRLHVPRRAPSFKTTPQRVLGFLALLLRGQLLLDLRDLELKRSPLWQEHLRVRELRLQTSSLRLEEVDVVVVEIHSKHLVPIRAHLMEPRAKLIQEVRERVLSTRTWHAKAFVPAPESALARTSRTRELVRLLREFVPLGGLLHKCSPVPEVLDFPLLQRELSRKMREKLCLVRELVRGNRELHLLHETCPHCHWDFLSPRGLPLWAASPRTLLAFLLLNSLLFRHSSDEILHLLRERTTHVLAGSRRELHRLLSVWVRRLEEPPKRSLQA